jgi:hypothetical protein
MRRQLLQQRPEPVSATEADLGWLARLIEG